MIDLRNEGGARQEKLREFDKAELETVAEATAELSATVSDEAVGMADVMDAIADLSAVVSDLAMRD